MNKIIAILFLSIVFVSLNAQVALSEKEIIKFSSAESELKKYTDVFKYDTLPFEQKVEAIHNFIPRFVAILKEKNSFAYPFDSLTNIMKVTAPDQTFKIYTWQLKEPLGTHKYYGAIQLNTNPLKLIPLFDYSDTMIVHPQEILQSNNWYGCVYYNILQNNVNSKNYYTLFGYDDADFVSDRKILEILSFDDNSNPVFGAPLIHILDTAQAKDLTLNRMFLEFDD
ncbi:MAG: hypothetical protein LRY27_00140 [Chitinophagales bacterium]|nr:hypothetical protein [Chitinophagales bacterium]